MSLRPWFANTGGFIGPSEAAPSTDRLRFLLELGAEKARQERVAKERALPVPTEMKRKLPNWMLSQPQNDDDDDDDDYDDGPQTPPRAPRSGFRLYNDRSIFRVTLSADQNNNPGPATFSGPFWRRVQAATTVFPPPEEGEEPPPPAPREGEPELDRSRRTYREFFRVGFGTFLNQYEAENVDGDVTDLLEIPEQDNAAGLMLSDDDTADRARIGGNFLDVFARLTDGLRTVRAWSDLPESLTISCGYEGERNQQGELQPSTIRQRFANVRMTVYEPSENASGAYEIDFLFPDAGVETVMAGRGYDSLLSAAAGSFLRYRSVF